VSRQRLGQHFLVRGSILERIAAAACPRRVPLVIEIGPGKGALTERLLARADRVVAIEIDENLAGLLRAKFPDPRLEVVTADVLDVDLNQWGPAVAAGNLPYYISTAILSRALAPDSLLERGVFLVQDEVAARIVAAPGSRAYGFLSAEMQLYADVRIAFQVRPTAFHPPPKVDSALIQYALRSRVKELGIDSLPEFLKFVRLCFHQKRKTIRNNLAGVYGTEVTRDWPEAPLRAEQLTLDQLAAMYRTIRTSASTRTV
jgi:16S rRNA (adenine1518-N6/adenine1519-N6)-dimethyltransferase